MTAARLLLALALVACGGKIAPDGDAGVAATCGAHQSQPEGTGPSCRSLDSVACTSGVYAVSCDCAAGTCTCMKDDVALKAVPFEQCSCTPSREQILGVYIACGIPY